MNSEFGAPIAKPLYAGTPWAAGTFPRPIDAAGSGLASSGSIINKHQPSHPLPAGKAGAQAQFGALLMADGGAQRSGPPSLFSGLTESEIAQVMGSGKRRVLYRGAQLFSQGSPQDGIFLIESGRIKVFYTAPSGREITLAYWHSGNFVGGPESSSRACTCGRGWRPSTAPCCICRVMCCGAW